MTREGWAVVEVRELIICGIQRKDEVPAGSYVKISFRDDETNQELDRQEHFVLWVE